MVYLGGLGEPRSDHLRSRAETAAVLAREGPPLTYFRAAMVIGAGSESYRVVRYLVARLPAMIAPAWLRNRTQPIAIQDVLEYLAEAAERPGAAGREVQIGGPDVVTYGDVLSMMANVLGLRRRPQLPVPFITPWLSSHWIGLVTRSTPAWPDRSSSRWPATQWSPTPPPPRCSTCTRWDAGGAAARSRRGNPRAAAPS